VQDDELELLKTLASELLTSAVLHPAHDATARVGLFIGASPQCLRVEVRDDARA
jgi:hypothetical protein